MEAITCLGCGFILGAYYDAFLFMMEILVTLDDSSVHVDTKFIDPDASQNLIIIYEALNIDKYCCRGQCVSCRNIRDAM